MAKNTYKDRVKWVARKSAGWNNIRIERKQ